MGYWDILRLSLATIDNPLLKCLKLRVDNLNDIIMNLAFNFN